MQGPAFGGGFEIVLSCDLVVAARSATFGLPEVSRGVVATTGGLFRAPRALPPTIAAELLLTGDPLDADRAAALGLVNRVVDDGQELAVALEIAERISANSPAAVKATLLAMHAITGRDDELGWEATAAARAAVLASPDAAEGKSAFLERRPPRWVEEATVPPRPNKFSYNHDQQYAGEDAMSGATRTRVRDEEITAFFAADPATIAWPYPMYDRWREGTG